MKWVILPAQIRAGRGLLDWSRDDLARAAGVAPRTVAGLERGEHTPKPATVAALRGALEAAGVRFTRRGVELRSMKRKG
jgi:transcriptional regulator with XRE-family HTH domain